MTELFEDVKDSEEFDIEIQLADVGQPNIPMRITRVKKGPNGPILISERCVVLRDGKEVFAGRAQSVISEAKRRNLRIKLERKPVLGEGNRSAQTPPNKPSKRFKLGH